MKPLENVPRLELVQSGSVRFHEHPERKRTLRLMKRLRDEKRLRNPPIVAETVEREFVLLDGANRVSALQDLGFSHLPVQVIDYGNPEVRLKEWHHLLLELGALDLRAAYAAIDGVDLREVSRDGLGPLLELRSIYAGFVDRENKLWGLFPSAGRRVELVPWMEILEQVVAAYEGKTRLERIKLAEYSDLPDVYHTVEHELVLFPRISKVELLGLVREDRMIPTGITRHLIPGRALGLNLELAFLLDLESEAKKIRHFRAFIEALEMQGRIRFYEESAFIMNE